MTQAKVPVAVLRRPDPVRVEAPPAPAPRVVVAPPAPAPVRRGFRYALQVRQKIAHPADLLVLLAQPQEQIPDLSPSAHTPADEVEEALAGLPLFRGVEPQTRAHLAARGRVLLMSDGEELVREGERSLVLVCLLRGSAKLFFTSKSGLQGVSQLIAAPATVGTTEIITDQPAQCSLHLLEKSEVLVFPADAFAVAAHGSPKLMENVIAEAGARLRDNAELARSLLFESAETRLARLLLRYLALYGLPTHGGTMIRLSLTQNDFAEALGLNRRSITRALTAWAKEGIVDKPSGQYVVRDLAKLEAIANP